MAFAVSIEGTDGSGKATLASALQDLAETKGHSAKVVAFPRYEATRFGALIGKYLDGGLLPASARSPWLAALLFAGDRAESCEYLRHLLQETDLLILDRYVASNAAYLAGAVAQEEQTTAIRWIEKLEYQHFELPRPQLTVLLHTPHRIASKLITSRDARSYTKRSQDLFEADADLLQRVAQMYAVLAEQGGESWLLVDTTTTEGQLRTPATIASEVWRTIAAHIRDGPGSEEG